MRRVKSMAGVRMKRASGSPIVATVVAATISASAALAQSIPPSLPVNPVIEATAPGSTTFNLNGSKTRLDVNSAAKRVVIKWDSFDIGQGNEVVFTLPDGKSIAVNRIACTTNCSASSINGSLRSNGNVWILNPAGVFFGVGARVDVAGLLATPAALDDLRGFVNAPTDAAVAFTMPANPGPVTVAGGAQLLVRGGPAVLVGRNVKVSGTVKAADDSTEAEKSSSQILYGAAGKFRLLLNESAPSAIASGDLDLFDFIIDEGFAAASGEGAASPSIDILANSQTRAGQVLVRAKAAAPQSAEATGGCASCISVESSLEATAADRSGPLSSALALRGEGVDLVLQRTARFNTAGAAVLDPLVSLSSRGSATLGARNIFVPQVQSLRSSATATPVSLPDHVTVELAAGGPISLNAEEAILLSSVKLGGANLNAKADVVINAAIADPNAGAIKAGGVILLGETTDAAGAARVPTANFTVGDLDAGADILLAYRKGFTAGRITAGGLLDIATDESVRLAAASALDISIVSSTGTVDIGSTSGGSFTGGAVRATDGPVIISGRGGVRTGDVSASGSVALRAAAGSINAGRISATALSLNAGGGDLAFGGGAVQSLRALATRNLTVGGELTSTGNAYFSAGGTFANTAAIRVTNGSAISGASPTNGYGGIDIRAADAEIGGLLSARGTGAGIQVLAIGSGGAALGDGLASSASSMQLSSAEWQRLDAATVALRTAESSSAGSDIVIGDLTLDRSRIGQLTLATGAAGRIVVRGVLQASGAPTLNLGEASLKPGGIEISGALGTSTAALGTLQLRSAGNILIGSSAFIDQVKAASDISKFDVDVITPTFGGTSSGQLFIVSGPTSFEASKAILQQNTGGRSGDGIRVAVPGSGGDSALIVAGSAGSPSRVALFGTVVGSGGTASTGPSAASTSGVLASGTTANPSWRINTCIAGSGDSCTAKTDVVTTIVATTPIVTPPPPVPVAPAAPATPSAPAPTPTTTPTTTTRTCAPASTPATPSTPTPTTPTPTTTTTTSAPASTPASASSSGGSSSSSGSGSSGSASSSGSGTSSGGTSSSSGSSSGSSSSGSSSSGSSSSDSKSGSGDTKGDQGGSQDSGKDGTADGSKDDSGSGSESDGESGDQGDSGGAGDSGDSGESSDQDANDEPDAGEAATAEVATASTQSAENDLKPIEVDPGSLDLLNPAAARELREAGVGAANEDLWPEGAP